MMSILFGNVLPWLLIAVGTWLGYQLVRQNGRILLRLESIDSRLSPRPAPQQREPAGLPVGALAPDFELPDLTGARRNLSDFRGKNRLPPPGLGLGSASAKQRRDPPSRYKYRESGRSPRDALSGPCANANSDRRS